MAPVRRWFHTPQEDQFAAGGVISDFRKKNLPSSEGVAASAPIVPPSHLPNLAKDEPSGGSLGTDLELTPSALNPPGLLLQPKEGQHPAPW